MNERERKTACLCREANHRPFTSQSKSTSITIARHDVNTFKAENSSHGWRLRDAPKTCIM